MLGGPVIRSLRQIIWSLGAELRSLADRAEQEQCHHDSTHRGGILWTICDDCNEKWADDEGGFKPYVVPNWIQSARKAAELAGHNPIGGA